MAATAQLAMDGTWQELATGPCNVAFEPQEQGAEWALDTDQLDEGHTAPQGKTQVASLATDEVLYIEGSGRLTYTVTA